MNYAFITQNKDGHYFMYVREDADVDEFRHDVAAFGDTILFSYKFPTDAERATRALRAIDTSVREARKTRQFDPKALEANLD